MATGERRGPETTAKPRDGIPACFSVLLPVLARDWAFFVLTITAAVTRLFEASRFAMTETDTADWPGDVDTITGRGHYENPRQASPAARLNAGPPVITNAQVYGDSPEAWRKNRLVEFVRRTIAALDARIAANPQPVVVVADSEVLGHVCQRATLGPWFAGAIEINPDGIDAKSLHRDAYRIVEPIFARDREQAIDRFRALAGSGDNRAPTAYGDIIRGAHDGRVDTRLLPEGASAWGRFDSLSGQVTLCDETDARAEDLMDRAAAWTLRQGGAVYHPSAERLPGATGAAAILRF